MLLLAVCVSLGLDVDYSRDFIGHFDRAELAQCARNIARGNGPVVDAIWVVSGYEDVPLTHGIRYWSLYVAYWIAPFFSVFGATKGVGLLAASAAKAVMAVAAFAFIRSFTGGHWRALACSAALLFDTTWMQHVNLLSDMYLAVAAFLMCVSLACWVRSGSWGWAAAAGLCVAAAIGAKPSGVLLVPVALAVVCTIRAPTRGAFGVAVCVTASVIGLTPLAMHNLREGGSVWWPDTALVAARARAREYLKDVQGVHHQGFYDPSLEVPEYSLAQKARNALRHNRSFVFYFLRGEVLRQWWLPFVAVSVWVLLRRRCRLCWRWVRRCRFQRAGPGTLARGCVLSYRGSGALRGFASAVFLVCLLPLPLFSLVHFEARYALFIAAPAVVLAFSLLRGQALLCLYATVLLSLFVGPYAAINQRVKFHQGRLEPDSGEQLLAAYGRAMPFLADEEVVMTGSPCQFTFHTEIRSIVEPYTENVEVLEGMLDRYGAKKIAVFQGFHRSPLLDDLAEGRSNDQIECIASGTDFAIGVLRPEPPRLRP